jgi:histidine ammonia-lyase
VWRRVVALPLQQVGAVDSCGGDPDEYAARLGDRIGDVLHLQDVGTSGLGDDHSAHCLTVSDRIFAPRASRLGRRWDSDGMQSVSVGVGPLTESDVVAVARHGAGVTLADDAVAAITASRKIVDALADDSEPHYGISTGFGALATKHIPTEQRALLQRSLIRSHAAGSGPEVEREVVRAMMLLRLSTLATGHTGVRPATAAALAALLDNGITPVVHEFGSLGCSGDLAPLAHVALALIGEGSVRAVDGTEAPAAGVLRAHGIEPVELAEKEGLALINGTDGMLGQLLLAGHDLDLLLRAADISAAMSIEALLGTSRVFAADLQALRPQTGQAVSAANLRALLADSPIIASHAGPDCAYVQDAYSMRCAPQVNGAARDTLAHARSVAACELASAVDNPVIVDGRVESNGNFHGAPIAYVLDFLAIPAADVASISERRTDRMLDVARSRGLPPFLAHDPGVDSGHMIAQYTQAALVSELKRLAVPASVDSIPSSAMQEDHVSMGWSAARKLRRSVDALTRVLAIEVLTAARALDLRAPLRPGPATAAVVSALREHVAGPGPDRHLSPEIQAAVEFVRSGAAVEAADAALPQPLR